MAIVVNTNLAALNIQNNLSSATDQMNKSMLRMSTGFKINSASDDAAGLAVSTNFETTLSSSKVASQNVQIGSNLLTTAEGNLGVIQKNLQRIRDLAEQSANGTYTASDRVAMLNEAKQRVAEISRVAASTDFNGKKLLDGTTTAVSIQVGTGGQAYDSISIGGDVFGAAYVSVLNTNFTQTNLESAFNATGSGAAAFLGISDAAITAVTNKVTAIGAYQNRLSAAATGLKVQQTNLSAANSTIKDADVAEESANYVKAQILQSASASLLAAANQAPSIALKLISG